MFLFPATSLTWRRCVFCYRLHSSTSLAGDVEGKKYTIQTRGWKKIKKDNPSKISSCPARWSCRESNPGPNIFAVSFLHVYSCIICRETAGARQTNCFRRWMILSRGHIIPRQHPVLFLSRRRGVVTSQPARRPKWLLNHWLGSHGIRSIAI